MFARMPRAGLPCYGSAMQTDNELVRYLSGFVTPARLARMDQVRSERTRYLSVVLEDIYQPHNASAVLRTCDALGVQDVHIVERRNAYRVNPDIALGSAQWLSLHRHRGEAADAAAVAARLKAAGYRIVATAPHEKGHDLYSLPLESGPIALVFGTELTGISPELMACADEFVTIPMFGFVESYNISVSAAICMSEITRRLRASTLSWRLSAAEQDELLLSWLTSSIKHSDRIIEEWRNNRA